MNHKITKIYKKIYKFYLLINVYNEGKRLHRLLSTIPLNRNYGVMVCDSPSTDGSTKLNILKKFNVDIILKMNERSDHSKTLLESLIVIKKIIGRGGGIIIVDGNGKDELSYVKYFISKIKDGYDYIQGSRFLKKGMEINTPFLRKFLIKFVHAPLTSLACRKYYTDSTNGFRAISKNFLDKNIKLMKRQNLIYYEIYFYICFLASRKKYKVCEIPVVRKYLKSKVTTKILTLNQYWQMLKPPLLQVLNIKYKLN